MKSAVNYATIMSVQTHYCLLIELKLCNVIYLYRWQNWGSGECPGSSLQLCLFPVYGILL